MLADIALNLKFNSWVGDFILLFCMGLVLGLILAGVMYITILERKLLGLSQLRLGPVKVGGFGVFQPILDGVKLMVKMLMVVVFSKIYFYFIICGLLFFVV